MILILSNILNTLIAQVVALGWLRVAIGVLLFSIATLSILITRKLIKIVKHKEDIGFYVGICTIWCFILYGSGILLISLGLTRVLAPYIYLLRLFI